MNEIIKSAYFSTNTITKPSHQHDCHQMIYIKKGSANFNTSQGVLKANSGNLVFFNHLSEHSIGSLSENYERYVLDIKPQFHSSEAIFNKIFMLIFSNSLTENFVLDLKSNSTEFENILENIVKESKAQTLLKDEMIEALFRQCLIMMYRLFPNKFEMINEKNFDVVRKIQKLFELHPEEQYTLSELSKKYNISISGLSHSFKKIAGTSVMNYLSFCRIDKAKLLLTDSNMNISEVYESCGFSDGSNFSRLFKQNTGISPTKYRHKSNELLRS